MVKTPEGWAPSESYIAGKLAAWLSDQFELQYHLPLMDSSQVNSDHWRSLLALLQTDYQRYRATILLFGTDTLAYSAALIRLFLPRDHSWVLTGSQLPWADANSDAEDNLELAISSCRYPGTWIAFGGKVLNGINCFKQDCTSLAAFQSRREPSELPFPIERPLVDVQYQLLCPTPGQSYGSPSPLLEALIVEGYGMGNVPADHSLIEYLHALPADCLILVSSQCAYGMVAPDNYASNQHFIARRPISTRGARREAVVAGLYAAFTLCHDPVQRRQWLDSYFAGWH